MNHQKPGRLKHGGRAGGGPAGRVATLIGAALLGALAVGVAATSGILVFRQDEERKAAHPAATDAPSREPLARKEPPAQKNIMIVPKEPGVPPPQAPSPGAEAPAAAPEPAAEPRSPQPATDAGGGGNTAALAPETLDFPQWLEALWPEAQARKVGRDTFDSAFRDVTPDYALPDLILPGRPRSADAGGQAEFIKSPAAYLDEASLARLTRQGQAKLKDHDTLLAGVEARTGVSRYIVLAIWGRESAYGTYRLPHNAIRVLATQAYTGRRKRQFRNELLTALDLLERKAVDLSQMRSSWAGAMGQTQFMPSDYRYARAYDGHSAPDPWSSLPDALLSAANQLVENGWIQKLHWFHEVAAPQDYDCTRADGEQKMTPRQWSQSGLRLPEQLQREDPHTKAGFALLMPAGAYGPAFLTSENFLAIKRYNMSELYALFVGHLADRIAGGQTFTTRWAEGMKQLRGSEVEELQRSMGAFYGGVLDGKAGSRTRAAVGAYQRRYGLKLDCWPTRAVLDDLRRRGPQPRQEARPSDQAPDQAQDAK